MNPRSIRQITASTVALVLALAVVNPSQAAVYSLRADVTTATMPDGVEVAMWGFADDTSGPGEVTIPGPTLTVAPDDSGLTIRLTNNLTPARTGLPEGVPVSIVIPGQVSMAQPVRFAAGSPYDGRIRSLAPETPADGATVVEYTWTGLKPGTYLYRSGTSMQVQVQMGLYGAMKKDFSAGTAYPNAPYTKEVMLFLSEIDPDLHAAVAADKYGPGTSVTSTINYNPKYFLVNGLPYSDSRAPIDAGNVSDTILLRILNAGLMTHVPTADIYTKVIAEGGNPWTDPKQQYSVHVAALGTADAILLPLRGGTLPIYDRCLFLTTGAGARGGMLAQLATAAPAGYPIATKDFYSTNKAVALNVPAPGVLSNDVISNGAGGTQPGTMTASLIRGAFNGTVNLNPSGGFTYTPAADFAGRDTFIYRASAGAIQSHDIVVTIDVLSGNTPPVAVNDTARTVPGGSILIDVLANDTDADGDPLTIHLVSQPSRGTASIEGNKIRYVAQQGYRGTVTFQYMASDGTAMSNTATVTVTIQRNQPPQARADNVQTPLNTPVVIDVLANDTDSDGTIDPSSVTITRQPPRGSVSVASDGKVTFTPAAGDTGNVQFRYTVKDDLGAQSNAAQVRVNIRP